MKFNIMNYINKLFNSKKFLVAFSLVCAVILWLVIDITENPTREITVNNISVSIADQTDDTGATLMVIGEKTQTVSVSVSGPGYIVSKVQEDDIKVTVASYADVNQPDTYFLNLTADIAVSGCTVTKITPSYIKVDYDYDTSADIPVEIDVTAFQTLLPPDREIFKSSLKNNSDGTEITALNISGPSEVVGSISRVVVTPVLPADVVADTQNFEATFTFYDLAGNAVDSELLQYNTDTYVRAVVYKVAEVGLIPTFNNLPLCYSSSDTKAPPYTLYRYNETARAKEEITKVKVRGPVATIDGLIANGLKLAPIDFMKVTSGNTSFNVSFALDEGVEVIDGTEEVTVSLKLGTLRTTTVEIQPSKIQFIGLPENLKATSTNTNKAIKVTVCYDRSKTSRVKADDFVLVVDCTGVNTAISTTKPITVNTKTNSIYAWAIDINPNETVIEIK